MENSLIYGDGRKFILLFKDLNSSAEVSFEAEDFVVSSVDIDIDKGLGQEVLFMDGNSVIIPQAPEPVHINLQIEVARDKFIQRTATKGGLLKDFSLFKNVKVSDMFKIINQKLKDREE